MTQTPPIPRPPAGDPPSPLRYDRLPIEDRERGLARLLAGSDDPAHQSVGPFVAYADEHGLDLTELWGAFYRDRLIHTALAVASPGRSAMLFISPIRSKDDRQEAVALVQKACHAQDPNRVRLIQSLVDPDQSRTRNMLLDAGFSDLAELEYLRRAPSEAARPLRLPDPSFRLQTWTPELEPAFERAILRSYEGTMDCPGLKGLRPIQDVIAGHRATGVFDPELWEVLMRDDEPVGVRLLAEVPQQRTVELVYLGLAPEARGRGLARALVRGTLSIAGQRGMDAVMLAVDRANRPALRVYRALGFATAGCRRALIWTQPHRD